MQILLLGFVCLVLVPAVLLAFIMNWFSKRSEASHIQEDELKFTISPPAE